ncbi:MAG: hypothetical protein ACRDKB_00905 [Actinomycetota bacterium]
MCGRAFAEGLFRADGGHKLSKGEKQGESFAVVAKRVTMGFGVVLVRRVILPGILVILFASTHITSSPPPETRHAFGRAPVIPSEVAVTAGSLPRPGPAGLVARVEDYSGAGVTTQSFPIFDAGGAVVGEQRWRVVTGTGNCCENYLAVTEEGRLLDFGGDYLYYSDDQGATWKRVRPADPLPNFGEGTVAVAPNGDIIGVAWNPYYGDRVVPFKYEASEETWYYTTTKLHSPFFDRESVAVIPGPFEIAGEEFPYVSVLKGGFPFKSPWYLSVDGLNYFVPSFRFTDQMAEGRVGGPLPIDPEPSFDWLQTQRQTFLTPLGPGRALAGQADLFLDQFGAPWTILREGRLRWTGYDFPSPVPGGGQLHTDSRGWLHYVRIDERLTYRVSRDGGKSWASTEIDLPEGTRSFPSFDSRANGRLGLTAVAVHAQTEEGVTQDLVYRFVARKKIRLSKVYVVGAGDLVTGVGLTSSDPRFDFANVVILPDGRIATSFMDSEHTRPALAIQE